MKDYNIIDSSYKYTLGSVFIIGILSHGMALFNKFSVHDDILCLFARGSGLGSGRWLISVLYRLSNRLFGITDFSSPLLNGILSIIFISFSACLIVWFLNIKRPIYCILIGGLMVSFPMVASLFGYMFTADIYMLSALMAILGAIIICKNKKVSLWFLGISLLVCSVGIYQAYIPLIMSIFTLYLIQLTLDEEFKWKQFGKEIGKLIITLIIFMLLYLVITKIFLLFFNYELVSYKGANEISLSPLDYLYRILVTYRTFLFPDSKPTIHYLFGAAKYAYYAVWILSSILSISLIVKRSKNDTSKALLMVFMMLLMPMCINFMYIMCPDENITSLLQLYGTIMLFAYNLWLLQLLYSPTDLKMKSLNVGSIIALVLLLLSFVRIDNLCYLKATFTQQQAISYYTTLITRIKSTEGYKDTIPVIFYGKSNINDLSIKEVPGFNVINLAPYGGLDYYINDYSNLRFMRLWCGYEPIKAENVDSLQVREIFSEMPNYPLKESIKMINDVMYVKLGENYEIN